MNKIENITTMKLYYFILLFISLSAFNACKSDSSSNVENMDDMRKVYRGEQIGFFTEEMNLSEEEAMRFWPIYNAYQNKRDSLWRAQRKFLKNYTRGDSEKVGSDVLSEFLDFDKAKDELQRDYVTKLQSFMSDERILQLFYTEYQFKHFMLNRIRGRHGHGQSNGKGFGRGNRNVDRPQPPSDIKNYTMPDYCIR